MFVSRVRVTLLGKMWLGSLAVRPWPIAFFFSLIFFSVCLTGETPQPASQPASHHLPIQFVFPLTPTPSGSQSCRSAPRRPHHPLVVGSTRALPPPQGDHTILQHPQPPQKLLPYQVVRLWVRASSVPDPPLSEQKIDA